MSHVLWRIAVDAPTWEADDLSGKGAEITGGRWNAKGAPVVYASATVSLACIETIVHFNVGDLPMNRYLVEITVPDGVWASATIDSVSTLPVGWDAEPPGRVSLDHGTAWLNAKRPALMVVPSVIAPEERNILIDPMHPDSAGVTARKVRRWLYDPRLIRPMGR